MSRRVLGASVFLNGFRRQHEVRNILSQVQEKSVTMPLDAMLDAWGIDDEGFRSYLAELEANGLEVVVRRQRNLARTAAGDPSARPAPAGQI